MRYGIILLLLVYTTNALAQEQEPAFWEDIQSFKKQDSISFPPKNAILFIGSSSFTMWRDVHEYFPGYTIINRGFGGSTLLDQLRYLNEIVFPYKPKQVVIYCGENDLASSDTITSKITFNRFKELFALIRKRLPAVSIVYVSMKPSPSRHHLKTQVQAANASIRNFLKKQKNTAYIDIYKKMMENNKPRPELFLADSLHMNAKGYAIWKKAIRPYLKR